MKRFLTSVLCLALILTSGFAQAQDFPRRKPGLWRITTTDDGATAASNVVEMCIDAAVDAQLQKRDQQMPQDFGIKCTDKNRREGKKFVQESTCVHQNGQSMTTKTVVSGDFKSTYRAESSTNYTPAFNGKTQTRSVHEGKWLSACKQGQRAGDVMVPGKPPMNVIDMQAQMDRLLKARNNPEEMRKAMEEMRRAQRGVQKPKPAN